MSDTTPNLRDQIAEALGDGEAADAVMHVIEPYILAIGVDATARADELAGRLEEALDQIARERRGRLAAEAAVRRALTVLDQRIGLILGNTGPELRTALTIKQPKETR